MLIEWGSFVVLSVAVLAISAGLGTTRQLYVVRNILIVGALMRIAGVFARYSMIFDLYNGGSDAVGYFEAGRTLADHFRALDFSIVGGSEREWGTQAIRYASGIVLTFVGPSVRGAFLVFSFVAFLGLVCMTIASHRANPHGTMRQTAALLFFWPTLWFWPSSIGKEAVLLLAAGLVTLGYVGRAERIHWLSMSIGLLLALAVRPHIAGVLAVAIAVAEWTSREWTHQRVAQSFVASGASIGLLVVALGLLGLGSGGVDTMEEFVRNAGEQSNQGGSAIGPASAATAIPMAFLNILGRPFVTEADSPVALASALEMMLFWLLVLLNRHRVMAALRSWRENRLLRFVLPFAALYVLMLGVTFQNLGIIARQRTLVMPAMLLILAAMPVARTERKEVVAPRRLWRAKASGRSPVPVGPSS